MEGFPITRPGLGLKSKRPMITKVRSIERIENVVFLGLTFQGRQEGLAATRKAWGGLGRPGQPRRGPGTAQEQLRNERREFQENRVFQAWEASGGPRGTQNRWGGLAGAKGKPEITRRAFSCSQVFRE